MYLFYSLIYSIAIIFLLPFEYLKRPKGVRNRWLRERLGLFGSYADSLTSSSFWIHAVSVGEVMASLPLLYKLRDCYPSKKIIISTITDTGQKVAREHAPESALILYLPFDSAFILRSMLTRIKPEILIVMETELWPNLFRVFKEKGIPVVVLNGRISKKSFHGYKKISFFIKRVLSCVDFFGMQNDLYVQRIQELGVHKEKVLNTGNFKFDTKPPSKIPSWAENIRGRILIAGSTHEGEEDLIISVYMELKKEFHELNLILAPRHPERFKAVEDLLKEKGVAYIKRSSFGNQHIPVSESLHSIVILLDTVGELSSVYGISDIAIIGKSFKGHGGQNPLEPAYWGKTIICGPHMENFPIIEEFIKEGAIMMVQESELFSTIKNLLLVPEKAMEIGIKAQEIYRKNAGAVERSMRIIEKFVHG